MISWKNPSLEIEEAHRVPCCIDEKRHTEEDICIYTEVFQAERISCLQGRGWGGGWGRRLSKGLYIYNT